MKKGLDALRFLNEWECDYCGKITNEANYRQKEAEFFPLIEKHLAECKEVQKNIAAVDAKKNDGLVYDDGKTLKEKGYSEESVRQIRSWGLINRVNLTDLKKENRQGVVKKLEIFFTQPVSGRVSDLIIFLTPRSNSVNFQNIPDLLFRDKPKFFFTLHGGKKIALYEKIVACFFVWKVLQKEREWNHNICLLQNNNDSVIAKFSPVSGDSSALTLYLGLLSAYYQKPISQEVAASGRIDIGKYSEFGGCPWCFYEELIEDTEENFSQVKISPVDGLEYKIPVAVKKGVKKLVLSTEQKKNYEQVVSPEIREKLKVYYVKNVEELEKLFWAGEFS